MTAVVVDGAPVAAGGAGASPAPGGGPGRRLRTRLRAADVLAVGTIGLRATRVRTLLTALGIAIGIAAMVSVVGISASSRADLLAELDELGTNLLQVQAGQTSVRRGRDAAGRRRPA